MIQSINSLIEETLFSLLSRNAFSPERRCYPIMTTIFVSKTLNKITRMYPLYN